MRSILILYSYLRPGLPSRLYLTRFPTEILYESSTSLKRDTRIAENFSPYHRFQTDSGAHPASYPMDTTGSFPGGKAPGAWSSPLNTI
jgi:hypothetical protein